jgi:bifunctional enzyme CysN/CysC
MELLALATAGSVDDGKSTLIGRLLYDSKRSSRTSSSGRATVAARGDDYVNLALLTDGLRAEREQGITIDVAYRYFATPRRKFIIADTPGHVQYTRNMVTGASTADLAMILVDARKGVLEQSRRHAFIASLLGIPHLVVCVNKMDLVDYDEERFERDRPSSASSRREARRADLTFIPISALHGDNVVDRSTTCRGTTGRRCSPPREVTSRRPQPRSTPLPGAVRDPADHRRAPRLPRLRRQVAGGVSSRRRGRRAAVGVHVDDRVDRHADGRSTRRSRRCR